MNIQSNNNSSLNNKVFDFNKYNEDFKKTYDSQEDGEAELVKIQIERLQKYAIANSASLNDRAITTSKDLTQPTVSLKRQQSDTELTEIPSKKQKKENLDGDFSLSESEPDSDSDRIILAENDRPIKEVKKNRKNKFLEERSRWTEEQDSKLAELVKKFNHDFSEIYSYFPSRNPHNIREHYENFVDPSIKRDRLNEDEKSKILELFLEIGSDWKKITEAFNKDKKDGEKRSWKKIHGFIYYRKQRGGLELSDHSEKD